MAEEHKKKKRKPHKIITTRAEDGSFGHEHLHKGESTPVFAGTSQNLDDLKQHMEDHFGGDDEGAAPEGGAPEAAPQAEGGE